VQHPLFQDPDHQQQRHCHGYFENAFGEQWVFTLDRTTRRAELRGGDIGWNTVHEVRDGEVGSLVLGQEEAAWLGACWRAAMGR